MTIVLATSPSVVRLAITAQEAGSREPVVPDYLDPLTQVFDGLRIGGRTLGLSEMTAPWAINYGGSTPKEIHRHMQSLGLSIPPREPKAARGAFLAIIDGGCSLSAGAHCTNLPLVKGDFLLMTRAQPYTLSAGEGAKALPLRELIRREHVEHRIGLKHGSGGPVTRYISGRFFFEDDFEHPLLDALPAMIHLRVADGQAAPWLTNTVRLLLEEVTHPQAGSHSVVNHLIHLLYAQTVRAYVTAAGDELPIGRVDPEIAPALALIQRHPERAWTVAALADESGLSRSVFAARFQRAVGQPPLQYLTDFRMRKARSLLRDGRLGMKSIATKIGYATESAFSNAFRRAVGLSPGAYRKSKL